MAHLFHLGFDAVAAAYAEDAGIWDVTQPVAMGISSTAARSGGSTFCWAGDSVARLGVRSLGGNYSRLFAGLGYLIRHATISNTPTACTVTFYDGATAQVGWIVRSDGSLNVYAGATTAATLLGSTAAGVIPASGAAATGADYKMVEMEVIFGTGTAGSVRLKVADVEVLHVTGVNTAPSGVAQANRVRVSLAPTSNHEERVDDFYVNEDSGAAPHNTFYGEAFHVLPQRPVQDGEYSQMLRGGSSPAGANWQSVDDTGNDNTDYNYAEAVGVKDLYQLTTLGLTGTICGVSNYHIAMKDDVGSRDYAPLMRSGTTDNEGTQVTLTGTYTVRREQHNTNPATGLGWTSAEVDSAQLGQIVKV
jgi:hypothetical protein